MGFPGGDLKDRFGMHFNLGAGASLLTRHNVFLSAGYNFYWGNNVRENVLEPLETVEGGIIGNDMNFASVFLRERAGEFYLQAGYLFQLSDRQRSGILATAGVGILTHKIRIVDDFDSAIQLFPPYNRGYDRLTSGFSVNQFIGYLHLGRQRMINFYAGIHLTEGFTQSLRKYNYDQKSADLEKRFDLLTTLKVGWILPFQLGHQVRYY